MTYIDKLSYYQRAVESAQRKLQQAWFNNFEDIACEVVLNVLTEGWRRDIARNLIEDYYQEFHAISLSGSSILQQLEREGYISWFRDEVAWGTKDDFVCLEERGKQVVDGLLPLLR